MKTNTTNICFTEPECHLQFHMWFDRSSCPSVKILASNRNRTLNFLYVLAASKLVFFSCSQPLNHLPACMHGPPSQARLACLILIALLVSYNN